MEEKDWKALATQLRKRWDAEKIPANLSYRTKLMHAYYRTGRQNELLTLLKQTDAFFHEKDRWNEGPLAVLANSCLENHLYSQSAAYHGELIPLHQRTAPRRGIGDGTLSGYYSNAARRIAAAVALPKLAATLRRHLSADSSLGGGTERAAKVMAARGSQEHIFSTLEAVRYCSGCWNGMPVEANAWK